MKEKKVPMRMCVGCREMKPKRELMRVVKSPEGHIGVDARGKAPGRGAYICPQTACFRQAVKTKGLERALEHAIAPEVYAQLEGEIQRAEQP